MLGRVSDARLDISMSTKPWLAKHADSQLKACMKRLQCQMASLPENLDFTQICLGQHMKRHFVAAALFVADPGSGATLQ